jgi:hypothetical protein
MRRLVKMSVVLLPISLFAVLALAAGKADAGAGTTAAAASSSQGQAAADLALRAWLAGNPAPIPGGRVVSWEGATPNRPPADDGNSFGASNRVVYPTEIDAFVVADGAGLMYRASVLVALDPAGGSTVLGSPSLEPIPVSRNDGVDQDAAWGSMKPGTASDEVQSAIRVWADALTSDDGSNLRLAVGDQDASHAYLPMPVLAGAEASAVRGVLVPTGDPQKAATQMIVRVSLTLTAGRTNTGQSQTATEYDVLVDRYDTGAPVVVAWGPPGSGPTLTPYQNAVPADVPKVTVQTVVAPTEDTRPSGVAEPTTAQGSAEPSANQGDNTTSTDEGQ